MVCEEIRNPQTKEEYIDYWTTKGCLLARETDEFKKYSEEKEEKFNTIIEMTVPWQRKLVSELIDDIKSLENARSSTEMYNTVGLIYNDIKKDKV